VYRHTSSLAASSSSFYCSAPHRDLHSFPTRRSSDLPVREEQRIAGHQARRDRLRVQGALHVVWGEDHDQVRLFAGLIGGGDPQRSEEHTSELQSLTNLVCRLLLEKKKTESESK